MLAFLSKLKHRDSFLEYSSQFFDGYAQVANVALEFVEDALAEGGVSTGRPDNCSSQFASAVAHCKLLANRSIAHMTLDESEVYTEDLGHVVQVSMMVSVLIDSLLGDSLSAAKMEALDKSAENMVRTVLTCEPALTMFPFGLNEELQQTVNWEDRFYIFNRPPTSGHGEAPRNYRVSMPRRELILRKNSVG